MKYLYRFIAVQLFLISFSFTAISQNAVQGNWSSVYNCDLVPAAAANMPDGRIMTWSAAEKLHFNSSVGDRTYTSVFDPSNNSFSTTLVTNTDHAMFCPGTANLADGRIMITGGSSSLVTTFYNPYSNTWSRGDDMNMARGYQSMCTLNDGRVFMVGGSWSGAKANKPAEIWSSSTGWDSLDNVDSENTVRQGSPDPQGIYRDDNHAWLFAAPDGNLFHVGPGTDVHYITTSGEGDVFDKGTRGNDPYAMNGTATMYDAGKVLTTGGAQSYSTSMPASHNAMNLTFSGTNILKSQTDDMYYARTLHNATVLPSGEVVVTGGMSTSTIFDEDDAVYETEIWDPNTGNWTVVADSDIARGYHSVAILMKDGRVWVGGGGLCGNCGVNQANAQIFTPPYMYNSNGSLASQPSLSNVPGSADYNSSFSVTSSQSIDNFVLMRLSSITHSVNVEQRRIPVSSSSNGSNNYTVNIPDNDWLPPGDYYLFGMNNSGVPSIGEHIRIGQETTTPTAPNGYEIVNGTYHIEAVNGNYLAAFDDVNNAITLVPNDDDEQKWLISHLGNGVHTIQNLESGKYLELDGGCRNGTNVIQSSGGATSSNKQWTITLENGNYFFSPVSCLNHALDKNNGDAAGTTTHLWTKGSKNDNQYWSLVVVEGTTTTPPTTTGYVTINGDYFMQSQANGERMYSPVSEVEMASAADIEAQAWTFTHLGSGVHTIQNMETGRFLEVAHGACDNYGNINTWSGADASHQRWYIEEYNGSYVIYASHCSSHLLDKNRGSSGEPHLWEEDPGNPNQEWKLVEASFTTTTPPTTTGYVTINGDYFMQSQANGERMYSPVSEVEMASAADIEAQAWTFTHLGSGVHTIQNMETGRYLQVAHGACDNYGNINTWSGADASHQRWYIEEYNGSYVIYASHCSSHLLDKNRGSSGEPHLWEEDPGNPNQEWKLVEASFTTTTPPTTTGYVIIEGNHYIQSNANSQRLYSPSADVIMASNTMSNAEVWTFDHLGDGVHTIRNNETGRYLEVAYGYCENRADVNTWKRAKSAHQKWKIELINGNYYLFASNCETHALDKNRGSNNYPHLWTLSTTNPNQQWSIISVNGTSGSSLLVQIAELEADEISEGIVHLFWSHVPEKEVSTFTFMTYEQSSLDFKDLAVFTPDYRYDEQILEYIDYHPGDIENFYMVRIDYADGSKAYSDVKRLQLKKNTGKGIAVRPNPASDFIILDLSEFVDQQVNYFISEMGGLAVKSGSFSEDHPAQVRIDLEGMEIGSYLLTTHTSQGQMTSQIISIISN